MGMKTGRLTRRGVVALAAAGGGALGVALAGCGGGGGAPAADVAGQSGELQWLVAAHTPETQDFFKNTLVPAYLKERPKAKVNATFLAGGFAELFEKRGTLYAAGSGPDVLQAGADDLVEYVKNKWTVNLSERLNRWKDWGDYYDVPKQATTYEGFATGIPAQLRPRAMLYRKDVFEQRGLKYPTTWDELRTVALQLTQRNGNEVTVAGFNPGAWGYQQFFPMVWQSGAEMTQPDLKKVLFNTPPVVDGLRFWNDLLNQIQPPGATVTAPPQGVPPLAAGIYASQVGDQGVLDSTMKRAPEVVDKILVQPPLKKERALSFFSTNWFCVGSQSKLPDLAFDLLTFFSRPEHLLEYNRTTATIVPRKSERNRGFMGDPRFQMPAWIEVVEKYARTHPPIVNIGEVNKVTSEVLADVRNNKKSPKDGVEEMTRRMQLVFDEFLKR